MFIYVAWANVGVHPGCILFFPRQCHFLIIFTRLHGLVRDCYIINQVSIKFLSIITCSFIVVCRTITIISLLFIRKGAKIIVKWWNTSAVYFYFSVNSENWAHLNNCSSLKVSNNFFSKNTFLSTVQLNNN